MREVDFDYFRIVSELLAETKEQIKFFEPYAALPYFVNLRKRLDGIETELKRQVHWELRELGQVGELRRQ